jgi:hypothetical protein
MWVWVALIDMGKLDQTEKNIRERLRINPNSSALKARLNKLIGFSENSSVLLLSIDVFNHLIIKFAHTLIKIFNHMGQLTSVY